MIMIVTTHPQEAVNKRQEEFLQKCPKESKRFHELLFSYGNATFRYHDQAKSYQPTETDFQEWIAGLPENIARTMCAKGFEGCKSVLSFTRYVNEKNDNGMEDYIVNVMGVMNYGEYKKLISPTD